MPKIHKNKININYRNIDKNKDELKKFKTIIIKRKNKYQTEKNKSFTERHLEKEHIKDMKL